MRLRKVKNAYEKLLQGDRYFIPNSKEFKGKWTEVFNNNNPIHIEIGCGKGQFMMELARRNPNVNLRILPVPVQGAGAAEKGTGRFHLSRRLQRGRRARPHGQEYHPQDGGLRRFGKGKRAAAEIHGGNERLNQRRAL